MRILILALLFFASGASSLIYQVLWLRLLALVFGVTVYAATTVLASFMAGLALGSAVAGRLADRVRSPLWWFGVVEIAIGLLAFGSQWILTAVTPAYITLQAWLPDGLFAQTLVRFTGSFLVLLAPTTMMGMTLPLMLKAAVLPSAGQGSRIGILYGTNTAGAVTGTLLAGYFLVGAIGMASSFRIAAAINVVIGLVALALGRTPDERLAPSPAVREAAPAEVWALSRIGTIVFALSGFGALALEVVWFRILVYFVPATTYAFSTMLAAVLLGLALGSYAASPLLRRQNRLLRRLLWLQYFTALAVPLAATALASAYGAGWHTTADVHVSILLAFPPAFLMGMSYPVALRLWAVRPASNDARLDATKVGDLNSANLIGGIAGAVAGGFLVLPVLGTQMGLAALSGLYMLTFLILLAGLGPFRLRVPLVAGAAALYFAAGALVPDMLQVASRRRHPPGERLFWSLEGAQTTAAVHVRPKGGRVLYLDGLHQAADAFEVVQVHRLIGHLPMVLHPNPQRAVVIGLGGGVTPGVVSQYETSVDLVELSAAVVEAADWFSHVNYRVLHQPNVRLRVDDGRNFLLSKPGHYDVATADLIQPEHAGAGNLYSAEYFRLVRRSLRPGGLALQWIGHRPEAEYKLILRTFLQVFPHTTLWAGGHLMVASLEPLKIERADFERKLQNPVTRAALEAVGLGTFEQLLALYVTGPDELRRFAGEGAVLTDDRPLLEYFRSIRRGPAAPLDLSSLNGDVKEVLR